MKVKVNVEIPLKVNGTIPLKVNVEIPFKVNVNVEIPSKVNAEIPLKANGCVNPLGVLPMPRITATPTRVGYLTLQNPFKRKSPFPRL